MEREVRRAGTTSATGLVWARFGGLGVGGRTAPDGHAGGSGDGVGTAEAGAVNIDDADVVARGDEVVGGVQQARGH